MLSLVTKIYQHNLFSFAGKQTYAYLKEKRQLTSQTIRDFQLGCAVNQRQLTNLFSFPSSEAQELLSLNLLRLKEEKIVDFFSERQLIIPLKNEKGMIVAFSARQVGNSSQEQTKYLHLPNYPNYQKSSLLYNYSLVKEMFETDFCYLVEGFFDLISLNQAGISNCLACLGTSLSQSQLRLLKKLKKKIVLFLDGDTAGQQATIKLAMELLAQNIECEVIINPLIFDPDEIARQSKEKLLEIVQKREDPYLFILQHFFRTWQVRENPQSLANFVRKIANLFRSFSSQAQEFLVTKLSLITKKEREEIQRIYSANSLSERDFSPERKLLAYCCKNRYY